MGNDYAAAHLSHLSLKVHLCSPNYFDISSLNAIKRYSNESDVVKNKHFFQVGARVCNYYLAQIEILNETVFHP